MYEHSRFDVDGFTVRIVADEDAESPREWDNLGIMVCEHGRYNLGDFGFSEVDDAKHALERLGSWRKLARWLGLFADAAIVLPLGLYDHSGISMYVGSGPHWIDSAGWDSGQVGVIYVTHAKVREEYGDVTPVTLATAEACLRSEVDTYDQYLRGDVYGYIVTDPNGDEVDSLWGMFGADYCEKEGREAAERFAAERWETIRKAVSGA